MKHAATIEYEKPNVELYRFEGAIRMDSMNGEAVPINLEQTLWRACIGYL